MGVDPNLVWNALHLVSIDILLYYRVKTLWEIWRQGEDSWGAVVSAPWSSEWPDGFGGKA